MKKLTILLVLCAALFGLLSFAACGEHEHTVVIDAAVNPSCTEPGKTQGKHCSTCKEVLVAQETIEPAGHAEAIDPRVEPTCTTPGKTEGKHCLVCGEVLEKQEEISETGHIKVIDPRVEPTCTTPGKTEGSHCSVCNTVIKAQTEIPATDHQYEGAWRQVEGEDVHYRECVNCGYTDRQSCVIDITQHSPTCTEAGYTHYGCDICKRGYSVQGDPATGHSYGDTFLPCEDDPGKHYKACLNDPQNPEHYQIEKCVMTESVVEPTCTTDGYTTFSCASCTYSYQGAHKDKLDHAWGTWQPKTKADASSVHIRYCTRDGEHFEEKPCDFESVFTAPTCTAYGYYTHTCKDCEYHYEQHTDERGEPYSPTGHNYGGVQWTNKQNGTHERQCTVEGCGHIDTQGCRFDQGKVTDPTCTAKGYTTFTCEDCGFSRQEYETEMIPHNYTQWAQVDGQEYHSHHCQTCQKTEQEPCQFKYETTDPTCEDEGYTTRTCDTCGDVDRIDPVEKLNHDFGDWQPNETLDGKPAHKHTCKRVGCDKSETQNCEMEEITGVPTCTNPVDVKKVCKYCHFTEDLEDIKELGHDWSDWTSDKQGHHYRVCQRVGCEGGKNGEPAREENDCSYEITTQDATCLANGTKTYKCRDCEHEYSEKNGDALGHDWGENDGWTPKGDKNHERSCKRCAEHEERACDFDEVTTPATCETDGFTLHTCNVCSNSYKDNTQTMLGHNYSIYESKNNGTHTVRCANNRDHAKEETCECAAGERVDPTCTTDGYTPYSCTKCAYSYQSDTVARLEHKYGGWIKDTDKTGYHYRVCEHDKTHREEAPCSDFNTDTIAPTCEDRGYTTNTCTACGYSYESDQKEKLGHEWTVSGKSTDGRTHPVVCKRNNEHTEMQPCNYDKVEIAATCTDSGYHIHTCVDCGNSYRDGDTDPTGHTYGAWTFDAEKKTHTHSCINRGCTDTVTEQCVFIEGETVRPTCTVAGYTVMTCSACNGSYNSNPVPSTGHSYGEPTYVPLLINKHRYICQNPGCGNFYDENCMLEDTVFAATCTTQGYTETQCAKGCGRPVTKSAIVQALGHVMEKQWTYTGDKIETHTHVLKCTRDGCDYQDSGECNFISVEEAPTCGQAGRSGHICEKCGFSNDIQDFEALQHNMSDWESTNTGKHYRSCQNPGCNYREEGQCESYFEIVIRPANCMEAEKTITTCSLCQYRLEESNGGEPRQHRWVVHSSTEDGHIIVCQYEDCKERLEGIHNYSESNICPCGWDGLKYEQPKDAAYVVVKSDDAVVGAKNIVIPATHGEQGLPVKRIGENAFLSNNAIETLVLPKCLEYIGEFAFYVCSNLKSVSFSGEGEPASTLTISRYAFSQNQKLVSFESPENLKTIEQYAFFGCSLLSDINIPDSVESIGKRAFGDTKLLEGTDKWQNGTLYIGKHLLGVKSDGISNGKFEIKAETVSVAADCFENLTDLTEIVIPSSVTIFGIDAFEGCTALHKVEFKGTVTEWLYINFENDLASPMHFAAELHIGGAVPNREDQTLVIENNEHKTVTAIPAGTFRNVKGIKKIILPETVTSIGSNAFNGCSDLEEIVIQSTLKFIGDNVLHGTKYYDADSHWENGVLYLAGKSGSNEYYLLESKNDDIEGTVKIKEGTLVIAPAAFENCTNLTAITIPSSMRYIGEKAFAGCTALVSATFEGDVTFFATNIQGIGRAYSTFGALALLHNPATAAYYLREYLPNEWNRIN